MIACFLRSRPIAPPAMVLIVVVLAGGCGQDASDEVFSPAPKFEPALREAMDRAERQDSGAAVVAYTAAIERDPHLVTAYIARGNAYHREGQYQKAVEDFNMVLRHEPRNATAYFARGQAWQAQGDSRRALSNYTLAIAVEPKQARWYYLRGVAYDAMADDDQAAGKASRAQQLGRRAKENYARARQLDPITDFSKLDR